MADRPKIPYETEFNRDHPNGDDRRWVRKLSERGKLTGLSKRIPFYGPPHYCRINDEDRPQGSGAV